MRFFFDIRPRLYFNFIISFCKQYLQAETEQIKAFGRLPAVIFQEKFPILNEYIVHTIRITFNREKK